MWEINENFDKVGNNFIWKLIRFCSTIRSYRNLLPIVTNKLQKKQEKRVSEWEVTATMTKRDKVRRLWQRVTQTEVMEVTVPNAMLSPRNLYAHISVWFLFDFIDCNSLIIHFHCNIWNQNWILMDYFRLFFPENQCIIDENQLFAMQHHYGELFLSSVLKLIGLDKLRNYFNCSFWTTGFDIRERWVHWIEWRVERECAAGERQQHGPLSPLRLLLNDLERQWNSDVTTKDVLPFECFCLSCSSDGT